jgi:Putative zinc-finger
VDHIRASELLGAFVLDACAEEEAAQIRAHIDTCNDCLDHLDRLNAVAGFIGANDLEAPPPALREAVLDAVEEIP